jgi:two-component system chemotaxis sensor kinase CheA
MGFNKMSNLTHTMEDVLSKLRAKELQVTSEIVNVLFEAVDLLEILSNKISEGKEEDIEISGVVQALRVYSAGDQSQQPQPERRAALQIRYLEEEKTEIINAMNEGAKLYHFTVAMAENCVLKGVRVFMVLREIERLGTIVKSSPPLKELEDEDFGQQFLIGILSKNSPDDLLKSISNITDVEKAFYEEIQADNMPIEKRAQAQADDHHSKSFNGQTVRVDIKKLDDLMNLVAELVINRSRLEAIGSDLKSKDLDEVLEQVGRLTWDLRIMC